MVFGDKEFPGRQLTKLINFLWVFMKLPPFVQKLAAGEDLKTKECLYKCLKKCDHHYCISERLRKAHDGNYEEGLFFSGENL